MTTIFTYGSLMFPEVWQRVVLGEYESASAAAPGYRRFAVRGETYPAMVAAAVGTVEAGEGVPTTLAGVPDGAGENPPRPAVAGVIYYGVSPLDCNRLDIFEGPEYRRERIRVILIDGQVVEADTYIHIMPERMDTAPWTPGEFDLPGFLGTYCGFGPV
jgi:gamma-glutamylcyclotransferase (GGCT)/AIG2-like uncharacterized protein YtfP